MAKIIPIGIIATLFFIVSEKAFAQFIVPSDQQIFETKEITFYGFDFTQFELVDQKREGQDIKRFMYVWQDFLLKHIDEKRLSKVLEKEQVIFDFTPTLIANRKLLSIDLISIEELCPEVDSLQIQKSIGSYKLEKDDGIGFVMHPVCFHKANKTVTIFFTFFDISTKEVIWSERIESFNGNQYNRVVDWGIATHVAFMERYIEIYKSKMKNYEQIPN
ncbi:hypothetical protein [Reichenbachiella ulvae]|uniref:DUF4468 domain-containing protein n=1 Tax=Reichenbachiella ulvae TaxID=2980104 RepID=A0ABT3CXQ3_9BACT|nr:hypothetical protein [Reichenbachiella ulvae]MCV9388387.1 hypothetical protein [Reichenbachiella ulvae]